MTGDTKMIQYSDHTHLKLTSYIHSLFFPRLVERFAARLVQSRTAAERNLSDVVWFQKHV